MEVNNRDNEGGGGDQNQDPNPNPNPSKPETTGFKGKSCKGALYFSSVQKSKSENPTCVGITRTLPRVPSSLVGETELEAKKTGRSLSDFKYACFGYSVYLENSDSSADQQEKIPKLPLCYGLEVLMDRPTSAASKQLPAPAQKNEEREQPMPQRKRYEPPSAPKEEYFHRFLKNADLVASGVMKNLYRLGNYAKDTLDDILYPYRRRPK